MQSYSFIQVHTLHAYIIWIIYYIEIDTINDIILICLSCFVVSAKFNEKDCNFPDNPQFISMLSIITKYKYAYSPYQLVEGELFVLRSLDYK